VCPDLAPWTRAGSLQSNLGTYRRSGAGIGSAPDSSTSQPSSAGCTPKAVRRQWAIDGSSEKIATRHEGQSSQCVNLSTFARDLEESLQ